MLEFDEAPLVIRPPKVTKEILLLHGLGDSKDGISQFGKQLNQRLGGDVKLIIPNAPIRPITVTFGTPRRAWYDIYEFSKNPARYDDEGLRESLKYLENLIDAEKETDNFIIAGFSQGAAISLLFAIESSRKLSGVVALSGYVPTRNIKPDPTNIDTPIFMGQGLDDNLVIPEVSSMSYDLLVNVCKMTNVTYKTYEGLGHNISKEEIDDVVEFIKGLW